MVKYASNIFEIIDLVYYPSKLFGMAPYMRTLDENGNGVYSRCPLSFKLLIQWGGMSLLLSATAVCRMSLEALSGSINFVQYLQGSLYFLVQVENLGKLLELLVNRNHFVSCLELINKSDIILNSIGLTVSYKLFHLLFTAGIILFPLYNLFIISPAWEMPLIIKTTGFTSVESLSFIFQLINSSFVYIIRNCSMYCHMSFVIITYQRFRRLNDYLLYAESKRRSVKEIVKTALNTTRDLHNALYSLTLEINKTFAWAIFDTISLMVLELIAVVVTLKYSSSYKPLHGYLGGATFVGMEVVVLITFAQKVKFEAYRTRQLLSELSLPHFDSQLTTTWISAMFQLLHEHIEFSACGFYSLDMTVIVTHAGSFCTVTMFFLKLYSS